MNFLFLTMPLPQRRVRPPSVQFKYRIPAQSPSIRL
jgi:hypothetical protein